MRQIGNDKVLCCTRHAVTVTACALSPSGRFCASGDKDGNVIIWGNRDDCIVRTQLRPLNGPVRDIAWSNDEERVIAVGEGKGQFAQVFAVDGANTIGSITGHSRPILSCDFRPCRPFRVVTGAQDSQVNFYEGPPFKFAHSVTDVHSGNVNCTRFSPSGEKIASVSSAKSVLLLDGTTGNKVTVIETTHTGSIYSLAWSPDGGKLATASADKSVKVYSVEGQEILSVSLGKSVDAMQQSVLFMQGTVMSFSLGGECNVINAASGAIVSTLRGHTRPILGAFCFGTDVVTVSGDGKILLWHSPLDTAAVAIADLDLVENVAYDSSRSILVCGCGQKLVSIDVGRGAALSVEKFGHSITSVAAREGVVVCTFKKSLTAFVGGKRLDVDLGSFVAHSSAIGSGLVAVGGENVVRMLKFDGCSFSPSIDFGNVHKGDVTAVTFNSASDIVASGDSTRVISVWNAHTGAVLYTDLVFHTARICALAFSPGDKWLASGSIDSSIIVWDLPNQKRCVQSNAHPGGVNSVSFCGEDTIVSGGGDCCGRKWTINS